MENQDHTSIAGLSDESLSLREEHQVSVVDRDQKLQFYFTRTLLQMNPGLGEKTHILVKDLVQSGLRPSEAYALLTIVYNPADVKGRGQGTRSKYFAMAVRERYENDLDKIRTNITTFRRFLAEVSEANETRDILKGEGYNITFHEALLYQEVGLDAEGYLGLAQDLKLKRMSNLQIIKVIRSAALQIKAGSTLSLESLVLHRESFGNDWDEDIEGELQREYESMRKGT